MRRNRSILVALATAFWIAVSSLADQPSNQLPDLKWDKSQKEAIDEALSRASQDPIAALAKLYDILEHKKKNLKANQKNWLQQQAESLRPRVLETFKRDFEAAAAASDVRAMMITSAAANEVTSEYLTTEPMLSEALDRLLAGKDAGPVTWKITGTSAVALEGPYSEGLDLTLTPPKEQILVRVKAKIENVSSESDKGYTLLSFGAIESKLGETAEGTVGDSYRWIDDSHIYLTTAEADLIPCAHVCSGELSGTQVRLFNPEGSGTVLFGPKLVKKGESMDIDVIFIIPKESREYRLFVLSSIPVSLGKLP